MPITHHPSNYRTGRQSLNNTVQMVNTSQTSNADGDEVRFSFGKNWSHFLKHINDDTIEEAEKSLKEFLNVTDLEGKSFLDLGSGSGLFSLAAWRLGAQIFSIDIDENSVECTRYLKSVHAENDTRWQVEHGSALDGEFLSKLERFDVVYSWGVLHHTGEMWNAIEQASKLVASNGKFFIAIYNDQGPESVRWTRIKRIYNQLPGWLRPVITFGSLIRIWGPTTIKDLFRLKPFHTWRTYRSNRGMNAWRDLIDWVGGYPFEVAKPEEIIQFCLDRGFRLTKLRTCAGGRGCNEFVFVNDNCDDKPDVESH